MIQKTYKAYLFDFDYTLADSSRGIVMCFRNVLAMHGHDGISDESIKRTIGKTLEESFTILTGIDDKETLAAYRKEYVAQADRDNLHKVQIQNHGALRKETSRRIS